MIIRFFFLLTVICFVFWKQPAGAVTIDLAYDRVDITTGFNGSSVMVFGAKHGQGDLVIVVEGPRKDVVVRKKDNVLGAWLNRSWLKYENVPLYYGYAVEEGSKGPAIFGEHKVGKAALIFESESKKYSDALHKQFQEALVAEKQRLSLFPLEPSTIFFVDDTLFRVKIDIPSNVPKGDYLVRALLFNKGKVVSQSQKKFKVAQVGFSFDIFKFAQDSSLLYGIGCVVMALFAGWVSNKITN